MLWIINKMAPYHYRRFIDVFGGSGTVTMNRPIRHGCIEDSTERFFKHETQMSALIGGENEGYERFHEFIAVSYTHLDVYKRQACELLRNLDNYQRITEGAYGYGQQRLQETLGLDDEAIYELDGYMDFEKYGQDCMENDCVTKTEFGLLRRLDSPFPEQRQGQQMFQ